MLNEVAKKLLAIDKLSLSKEIVIVNVLFQIFHYFNRYLIRKLITEILKCNKIKPYIIKMLQYGHDVYENFFNFFPKIIKSLKKLIGIV